MTKKLLSVLLAVLMVLTFVTPAMAATKPTKLKSTDVDKMQIRAYASGTETFHPGSEMYSCSPTIKAKGVDYTIGEVEGNEEDGYTTTVTFHFKSGDKFEEAAKGVFNTDKHFLAIKEWADHWVGDWTYDFTEERPADQVLTLYWVVNSYGRGSWKIKSTLPGSEYAGNITTAVANLIQVNLKLERTVVYTDGVSGEVFDNQTYTVRNGEATPDFVGTIERDEYKFLGWDPEVAEKVYENVTYTAQWEHVACDKHLEDVKVITEPTCTEDGLKLCRCTVCGKEMEVVIPALGHDHSGNWTWNREEHWKKCLRCGDVIDCEEHTYGDWKPVVDEKGNDTNREERSCTVCGFTQYSQTLQIGGGSSTVSKPADEQNPNTGAQVPSLLPALAVLAGAAILLGKRK